MIVVVIEREEPIKHWYNVREQSFEEIALVNLVRDDKNQVRIYENLIKKDFNENW
jgi:hypothetical protein